MNFDAEILAPHGRLGEAGLEPRDPRRWAAPVVMLLAGFMNLPARRGHSAGAAAV
jgi:hypothetical protein